jgi:SAM-dependent methyltransferase
MKELLNLGELYISDFIRENESPRGGKYELKLVLDESVGAPKLEKVADQSMMFGKYWYRSGINHTMKKELKEIVDDVMTIKKLKENDIWLDIASNDGTLLSFLPKKLLRIGVDPCDDSYKVEAEKHADLIIQDFFSSKSYKDSKFGKFKAKVITCIAMFYDLEDPKKFLREISEILDDGGIFVLQMSYTPLMIKQLAFDNICHEHVWYYSLFNIKNLLEEVGFKVFNCELNDVNGGSFRVYATPNTRSYETIGNQQYRDVSEYRINSILEYEKTLNLNKHEVWQEFFSKIEDLKHKVVNFIKEKKLEKKKVWAYGASTKGNTLLQYFGLDSTLIDGIAERSPYKWGLKTVGTNIPIYSEDEMRKHKPDYLLVLPWHFINEFVEREQDFLKDGGTFIVPCPQFELITYKK